MKDLGAKCFRRRALRYGGQVGFTKMDAAPIRRIKESVFVTGDASAKKGKK